VYKKTQLLWWLDGCCSLQKVHLRKFGETTDWGKGMIPGGHWIGRKHGGRPDSGIQAEKNRDRRKGERTFG